MDNGINLFNIYTPKELAAITVMDIKNRRYNERYAQRMKEHEVDTFVKERSYIHRKSAHRRK